GRLPRRVVRLPLCVQEWLLARSLLPCTPVCIAVLASGKGTILQAILEAGIEVVVVLVDRPCAAEEIAAEAGVAVERVPRVFGAGFGRDAYTDEVVAAL